MADIEGYVTVFESPMAPRAILLRRFGSSLLELSPYARRILCLPKR